MRSGGSGNGSYHRTGIVSQGLKALQPELLGTPYRFYPSFWKLCGLGDGWVLNCLYFWTTTERNLNPGGWYTYNPGQFERQYGVNVEQFVDAIDRLRKLGVIECRKHPGMNAWQFRGVLAALNERLLEMTECRELF
jgi:hypothetical protein